VQQWKYINNPLKILKTLERTDIDVSQYQKEISYNTRINGMMIFFKKNRLSWGTLQALFVKHQIWI
jgi:hypothetical protein